MTIFEKIIAGDLPASFIHQDERCVSFMDIHPLNEGHVLVVPRTPAARLTGLDPETAAHLFTVARKILEAIQHTAIRCEGANIFLSDGEIAGQEVPHVHLHIVPRFRGDGVKLTFGKKPPAADREVLDRAAQTIGAHFKRRA
jgi:histidine triad (HIT) family protein